MKIGVTLLLLDDAIDDVLGAAKIDLPLQHRLDMLVVALHLQKVDIGVLGWDRVLVHLLKDLA